MMDGFHETYNLIIVFFYVFMHTSLMIGYRRCLNSLMGVNNG